MFIQGWFTSLYSRNECNTAKQLYANKKVNNIKLEFNQYSKSLAEETHGGDLISRRISDSIGSYSKVFDSPISLCLKQVPEGLSTPLRGRHRPLCSRASQRTEESWEMPPGPLATAFPTQASFLSRPSSDQLSVGISIICQVEKSKTERGSTM